MRKVLALALFGSVAISTAPMAAESCGDITIGALNWQSADLLANLDAFILKNGYGCNVSVVAADTVPSITSMVEKGQPDAAPEANLVLLPAVAEEGLKDGRVFALGHPIVEGTLEGWYIPKYLTDKHPEIKTVADALKHPELFPAPEDPTKGGVLVGPQGWGGTVVTTQLFKAFKAEQAGFDLVETGSAAGLDGAITKAYERKQGFLTYYWSPTSLMAKYPLTRLEGGVSRDDAEWKRCTTNASCSDPKPNYWTASPVVTLVTKKLMNTAGMTPALDYFKAQAWSTAVVSEAISWMQDNQASGPDGAAHFLKTKPEIWTKWVPADVAEKVKAAL